MSNTDWRQEQKRRAEDFSRASDDWRRRWFLSLAVANGAGAIGLTSAIVNTLNKEMPPWLLMPGLGSFVVGLILAGCLPILQSLRLKALADHTEISVYEFQHGYESVVLTGDNEHEYADTLRFRYSTARKLWEGLAVLSQWGAAIAFVLGVFIPFVTLIIHWPK